MSQILRLTLCLCCLVQLSASESANAELRLSAQLQRARDGQLQAQQTVEAQRRDLLSRIAAAQERVRTQQGLVAQASQKQQQLQQQLAGLQQATSNGLAEVGRLARSFAGEGVAIAPSANAQQLLAVWPEATSALQKRIVALRASTKPHQQLDKVLDRQGNEISVPVWHWGAAQRVALGDGHNERGLLLRLDDGFWQIGGPALNANLPAHFMVADLGGRVSLDHTDATGVSAFLQQAGPFVWPILAAALWGLWLIIDRCWLLWRWGLPQQLESKLLDHIGDPATALQLLQPHAASPSGSLLARIIGDHGLNAESRQQRAGAALVEAETRIQRGLRLLAVLAAAAPLLGLLGTVTGMISSFEALNLGQGNHSDQLSSGIGEALLTTELGLIVAVPLLVAHAVFVRDAQRRRAQAEAAAMRLLAAQDSIGGGND